MTGAKPAATRLSPSRLLLAPPAHHHPQACGGCTCQGCAQAAQGTHVSSSQVQDRNPRLAGDTCNTNTAIGNTSVSGHSAAGPRPGHQTDVTVLQMTLGWWTGVKHYSPGGAPRCVPSHTLRCSTRHAYMGPHICRGHTQRTLVPCAFRPHPRLHADGWARPALPHSESCLWHGPCCEGCAV